ncbi:arylalcohol dehydrogenase [Desarmillaria tabescens]|uniref:Arylalcohol dehydrogenase n=1 Tax=Armillaria tabescens TaxID=1929756 RepID=A0AA39T5I3_ARMTA|nr:arylalcohol dehydrogenase [Desarmillaria tabescens]KAK0465941.1 arylalcohol dehydrogenase [Desarmillaria tabescens]
MSSTERLPFLPPPPNAPSPLGQYRLLSPRASIRVSPFQLGGMSIGTAWGQGMGKMTTESSFELLDAFYELGGNFIDTAVNYQDGTSEELIGEWMELRGNRDQMVIATKYSGPWKLHDNSVSQKVHYLGNGSKARHLAINASLKRLHTDYIDILYVHFYDWETSVEELMTNLHNLVVSGKVLHLGISDTPAWVVAKANQYAIDHGKTPFCIYQGQWNLTERSFEREIIPMARDLGLALAPWGVLGAGRLRTDAEDQARKENLANERTGFTQDGKSERNEAEIKVSAALEKVANEVGAKSIQAVAIAYHLQKTPYVFPILGGRKIEHLKKNIEAFTITLSKEQIDYLESALPFDPGFPNWLIGGGAGSSSMINSFAPVSVWPKAEAIKPAK